MTFEKFLGLQNGNVNTPIRSQFYPSSNPTGLVAGLHTEHACTIDAKSHDQFAQVTRTFSSLRVGSGDETGKL